MRPWLRLLGAAAVAWFAGEEGCAGRLEAWWLTADAAVCGTECWWCADLSFELRRSANDVFVGGQDIGGGGCGAKRAITSTTVPERTAELFVFDPPVASVPGSK